MNTIQNPMADMLRSQTEASRRFAKVLISCTGRIDQAIIEATQHAITNQLSLADAIVSIRDPKELAGLRSKMMAQRPENALNLLKVIMQVSAEIQSELVKSMQEQTDNFGSRMAHDATAPAPSKKAHHRTDDEVFNPMAGMFSMWESALQQASSMAGQQLTTATHGMQRAAENLMDTTAWDGEGASAKAAEIAKIAAQAAADAAATVLHEHLVGAKQDSNGSGRSKAARADRH